MGNLNSILPNGYRFREAWDFKDYLDGQIPTKQSQGKPLNLTTAYSRRICDGVHFTGAATSNINCGAIHNGAGTFWVSLRFKLDTGHAAGAAGLQYLFGKYNDATHFGHLVLENTTGKLFWYVYDGVTPVYISSVETIWTAGVWYHVLASVSAANGGRLIVNAGTAVTSAATTGMPAAGDMVIGSQYDGLAQGIIGTMKNVVFGTDDLTSAEELELYYGVNPDDATELYMLNEGLGTTAYDLGSGGNNGTLDSACTWTGVRMAALGSPMITGKGKAISPSTVDLRPPMSMVYVARWRYSDQQGPVLGLRAPSNMHGGPDNNNWIRHVQYWGKTWFSINGSGVGETNANGNWFDLDDYGIITMVYDTSGNVRYYVNGVYQGVLAMPGAFTTPMVCAIYLNVHSSGSYPGNNEVIFAGVVSGELSPSQVKVLSRRLDQRYRLGLGI